MHGPLQRYWQSWQPKLEDIVRQQGNGARVHFGEHLKSTKTSDDLVKIEPVDPVCFYDAPQKASSRKLGPSHKYVIFVNGHFEIENSPSGPLLVRSTCSVTFFNKHEDGNTLKLSLVDAVHFDVETVEAPTPFHPTFHVQRGVGITQELCQRMLAKITGRKHDTISVDLHANKHVLANPAFRIPTPQLDIFSVLTMLAADYFCNPGLAGSGHGVTARFTALLALLAGEKNFVKQGKSAQQLNARFDAAKNISAAHWYPECTQLPAGRVSSD
jgi:hypothetical protein